MIWCYDTCACAGVEAHLMLWYLCGSGCTFEEIVCPDATKKKKNVYESVYSKNMKKILVKLFKSL